MPSRARHSWSEERKAFFEPAFWIGAIGGSLFWTWLDDFLFRQSALHDPLAASRYVDHAALITSLGSLVFLVAVLALSLQKRPFALHRSAKAVFLFAVIGFLGNAATAFAATGSNPLAVTVAGLATSVSMGLFTLAWGYVCTREEPGRAMLYMSAVGAVSLLLNLLLGALVPEAKTVFVSLLPLASGALFVLYSKSRGISGSRDEGDGCEPSGTRAPRFALLGVDAPFLASVLVFSFAFGIMYGMEVYDLSDALPGDGGMVFLVTRGIVALLFLLFILFSRTERLGSLFRICLSLMIVGLVAIVVSVYLFELLPVSAFLMSAGYATFNILLWTLVSFYGKTTSTPLIRIIVLANIVDQASILAGSLIGGNLKGYIASAEGVITLLVVSYLLVLSLMNLTRLSMLPWNKPKIGVPAGESRPWDDSSLRDELKSAYGLTEREADVLLEFAKGRSTAYIAEKDCVSESTVKTHVRHFYVKLDVHNRQELLDLIDALTSAR